jgi:hypothetical protein
MEIMSGNCQSSFCRRFLFGLQDSFQSAQSSRLHWTLGGPLPALILSVLPGGVSCHVLRTYRTPPYEILYQVNSVKRITWRFCAYSTSQGSSKLIDLQHGSATALRRDWNVYVEYEHEVSLGLMSYMA